MEKPQSTIFDLALEKAGINKNDFSNGKIPACHIGDSLDTDVRGALSANWEALHLMENFDEHFPDWSQYDSIDQARDSQIRSRKILEMGRKDLKTNQEWIELWGLDDILYLFGFPEDFSKPFRTTTFKGLED
jgi:hypothetical protein